MLLIRPNIFIRFIFLVLKLLDWDTIYLALSYRKISCYSSINSLRPTDTYMPTLVQIMACRMIGAKPLSEPMLEYY